MTKQGGGGRVRVKRKEEKVTLVHTNAREVDIYEICSDSEHVDAEIEDQQYIKLRGLFSGKKSGKKSHQRWTV